MLQELGKQNPQLVRLIQEHQADFLRLINEPVKGEEWVLYHHSFILLYIVHLFGCPTIHPIQTEFSFNSPIQPAGMSWNSWKQQCHKLLPSHLKSVKPLNGFVPSFSFHLYLNSNYRHVLYWNLGSQLEAMGFDRAMVLEVFFACNKNEELAANYLLDHMHEFEEQ